jgi:hypothetical protein
MPATSPQRTGRRHRLTGAWPSPVAAPASVIACLLVVQGDEPEANYQRVRLRSQLRRSGEGTQVL